MEYRLELDSSFRMHISGSFTTQEQQHQQMTVQYFTTQQTAANGGDINDFIVMKPLPFALDFNAAPYKMQPYVDFRNCVGLFTAPYGSHGIEILHLSLHPSPGIIPSCIKPNTSAVELFTHFNNYLTAGNGIGMSSSSNSNSIGVDGSSMRQVHQGLELRGLKVSGDPNVPAGKLSFIVNLSNVVDIDTEMANDQRFIVIFPHESPSPTLLSLDQRKHNIAFWARGYGQVNRLPAEWKPEWVGCSFIMYKTPLAHGGATFSLVWDDETDPYFRHAMDFQPLPRGNAPPYSQNSRELFPTVA